jgi:hypothetical protein
VKTFIKLCILLTGLTCNINSEAQTLWGRLANPGFENQYIKSMFFFAGNWRNGVQFYEYNPSDNTGLYTEHPSDSRHLGWSEDIAFRNFAVNKMIEAGVNVINMSYWGPRGTDNWAYWAPMQTSTYAHDELFDAAINKKILVAPYIESYAATNNFTGFSFPDSFPGNSSRPVPQLIVIIEDLVDRYLIHPNNTSWPEVWARAYDQDGTERYIISLIHVSSNQTGMNIQAFAAGFDLLANLIFEDTGIRIGFLLDALPVASYSPGSFKITPENADPWLANEKSILGVQCFIPEIWTGYDNDNDLISWKRDYSLQWSKSTLPLIMDISPGYNASVTFPGSMIFGNNQEWRDSLTEIVKDIPANGITVNTWNGYTEGFAVVPTLENSTVNYTWVKSLYDLYTIPETSGITEPSSSDNNSIQIYPNPVKNELFIMSYGRNKVKISYAIYTLQGQCLSEGYITSDKPINTGNLAKGNYILFLHPSLSKTEFHKIIKE